MTIGKHFTTLDSLVIRIGSQGAGVETTSKFTVSLEWEHEEESKITEYDPGTSECFEIWNIRPITPVRFQMPGCIEILLDTSTKLDYILSDSELELITDQVYNEIKEQHDQYY